MDIQTAMSSGPAPQAHASMVARAPASGAGGPPQHAAAPAQDAAAVELPSAGGASAPWTAMGDSGSSHSRPLPQRSRGGGSSQHDDLQRPFPPYTAQSAAQPEDAPGRAAAGSCRGGDGGARAASQPAAKYRNAWGVPGHAAGALQRRPPARLPIHRRDSRRRRCCRCSGQSRMMLACWRMMMTAWRSTTWKVTKVSAPG